MSAERGISARCTPTTQNVDIRDAFMGQLVLYTYICQTSINLTWSTYA
jgi:hypothetical protein